MFCLIFVLLITGCELCYYIYQKRYRDIVMMLIVRLHYNAWWILSYMCSCPKCGDGEHACARCCRHVERCVKKYINEKLYSKNSKGMLFIA